MAYPGYGNQPQQPGWTPPGVDPLVVQWFQTVDTDRTGRINETELQQALTNGNWSNFNIETCRLMIGMFDRDRSGQIDLSEFQSLWTYIHQWKAVFDQFDTDRSGSIGAQELHTALNQMGYRVTPQFANMIVFRFDSQARRALTFDNFIQSCVLLKNITDAFRQRDTTQQGVIRINYEDYMTLCMLNKP